MEVVLMMHVLSLALEVCAFAACSLWIHGSAVPLLGEGTQNYVSNSVMLISKTPAQVPQSDGLYLQPPNPMPSQSYARAPQTPTGQPSLARPSSSMAPDNIFVPILPPVPALIVQSPAPATSPSSRSPPNEQTSQAPSNSHSRQAKPPIINVPIAPVSNVPAPWRIPESRPPSHSVTSSEPPSPLSEFSGNPPPVEPIMNEPPTNPPEQTASPIFASPPSINMTTKPIVKVSPPLNKPAQAPVSYSPTQGPTLSNPLEHSDTVPPPRQFSKSTEFRSPRIHRHPEVHNSTRAPEPHVIPPPSPVHLKPAPPGSKHALIPAPAFPSQQTIFPIGSPRVSPSGPSPRIPKLPRLPPMLHLPPPPPHRGCAPMICTEPYTYGPPETPCVCLLPIQAGLRLNMALYSFFPLVSELASEIASGVFMKQSQVRIMGANEAEDNPDKTIVLIDLLPLERKFDNTTAYITFQRFWQKKVIGKIELFGDYDVLYVQYPGLPPSPPSPLSTGGIISSKPYPGRNGPKPVEPLGVDVSGKEQKHGLGGIILATIVLSCFVAVILLCAVAWVFVFRYRHRVFQPDPSPPAMFFSQAKSSGLPVSMIGSATNSPSFSLGSSMPPYTGSAKTFTSHDIKRATDYFNEARMIGEGGFGRVYSGVLDDETKVAVKILKRYDQQGGREFLAEVEMLSRLHHRNLVKLIGICVEDPTRCLVYELVPNGSVESHLHGCDKEISPLDWNARLKIALGAARALAYLHEDSSPCVIHRDFKASNILLEDDFMPKVSDFGLARTALDENRHISTRVMGTFGYVAPEYAMTGHLLVKSDVYSYGVVLLELLTGRKPVDMSQPPGQENLVSWARPLLASPEGLLSIADQSILGSDSSLLDSISKVAAIASMCVQPEVSNRPFMGEVVQALKLVCNECDENRECLSRNLSSEDFPLGEDVRESTVHSGVARLPAPMLSPPSTYSDYDYRMDIVERDLSMSGLLSPLARFGPQDSESFRRHSSSGPLRTGQAKPIWRMMKRFPRGSVSEHGARFRLWPGSH